MTVKIVADAARRPVHADGVPFFHGAVGGSNTADEVVLVGGVEPVGGACASDRNCIYIK